MSKQKKQASKYYFKRYLLGCDYSEFINWLDKYYTRLELEAISTFLFNRSMDLGFIEWEDEDTIVNKALENIEKYWFWWTK